MKCKICSGLVDPLFTTDILTKYTVQYVQCSACQFIQTEEAFWLEEAYNDAISSLDIGYVTRNIMFSEIVSQLLKYFFNKNGRFIDYGGGYGMFVRLLRDNGFKFERQDLYCENLFAQHFDVSDQQQDQKFDLLTSFEVFEHLENPLEEISKMFKYSDSILFSTQLQPEKQFKHPDDWWYFIPETGQHIALFSLRSLHKIQEIYGCNLYTNGKNLHLLTKRKFSVNPIKTVYYLQRIKDRLFNRNFSNPRSLIESDLAEAKAQLVKKKKQFS